MEGCIFCAIVAGEAPSYRVYEDDATVAFLDINPAVEGHTLVIPRRHSVNLFDIDPADAAAVGAATVNVAAQLREALKPDGINMVHASGSAAWQSVFHFHVHLLPRYFNDSVPFWGLMIGRGGSRPKLEAIASQIRDAAAR